MTAREYQRIFTVLVSWGHDDETARKILHDIILDELNERNEEEEDYEREYNPL